jgi:hypothetical protein
MMEIYRTSSTDNSVFLYWQFELAIQINLLTHPEDASGRRETSSGDTNSSSNKKAA